MRVIVVEDDLFVREMAVVGPGKAGFAPIEAASGSEALRLLKRGIVVEDLLTDTRLPGANGWAMPGLTASDFPICPCCM